MQTLLGEIHGYGRMTFKRGTTLPDDPQPRPHVDCCRVGCGANALIRLKTPTGWGNFCTEHYIRYWQQHLSQPREVAYQFVNQHCEDVRKRFANSKYARLASEIGPEAAKRELMREPGSDDEEVTV